MECLIVADDLTGACDAAGPFAARGYTVRVALQPETNASDVVAISTDTRDAPLDRLPPALTAIARTLNPGGRPRIIFKKIDSTLRGNAPAEIAAALDAFDCAAAIVTPAFPAMRRVVIDGVLSIHGLPAFAPIDLPAHFRQQGIAECVHTRPRHAADSLTRARIVTCDAASDEDLDAIVTAGLSTQTSILWAGSSGLAAALARALPRRPLHQRPASDAAPILFCAGSDHAVTLEQQQTIQAGRPVELLHAGACDIAAAIRAGRHVILRLPRGRVGEDRVRALLSNLPRIAALMATGGDTASLVYRALGMRAITLHGEISPGIPYGVIEGGPFDGRPIVTKSGGFGAPSAFIEIADFFACPKI